MTEATPMRLTGRFLIATPNMGDPRFKTAVIYICSHDESGAMGIMVNKGREGRMLSDMLENIGCLLYTSPSPRDRTRSRMPSSA